MAGTPRCLPHKDEITQTAMEHLKIMEKASFNTVYIKTMLWPLRQPHRGRLN